MSDDLGPEQPENESAAPPPLDAYPPTEPGVGRDQYNAHGDQYFNTIYREAAMSRSRRASAETIAAQLSRFVIPEGLTGRIEPLEADRLLVLVCADSVQRCGQASAAWFLVHRLNERRLPADRLTFQEMLPTEDQRLSDTLTEATQLALFFNFVGRERDEVENRLDELTGLGDKLVPADSFAVVAVGGAFGERAAKWLPKETHWLARPDPEEVFRRHAPGFDPLLRDPWLRKQLAAAWPPSVADTARQAISIRRSGIDRAEEIVQRLRAERPDWTGQIRSDLKRHSTANPRALLFSAAVLEGSNAVAVVAARDLLLDVSRYPGDPVHLLERPDAVAELATLGEFDALTATFNRIGYGPALLQLIWKYQPALRATLANWWRRIPTALNAHSLAEITPLIDSLTALAEAEHDEQIAIRAAQDWSPPQGIDTRDRIAAVLLLQRACLSRIVGGKTRRWLYRIAYELGSYPRFRAVLAEVLGLFDRDHQSEAMTRLKHLGNDPDPEVTKAVVRSVVTLADGMRLAELLGYLTEWLRPSRPGARTAAEIVSAVLRQPLDPETDFASPAYVRFWRSALKGLPDDQAAALALDWLRLGLGEPTRRDPLFRVLLFAAGDDLRRQSQLYYAIRATDDAELAGIFADLRVRLDQSTSEWIF